MNDITVDAGLLSSAKSCLEQLLSTFEQVCEDYAQDCSIIGKLDGARLDERQWAAYEIAVLGAEIIAARNLTSSVNEESPLADRALVVLFAGQVMQSSISKLNWLLANSTSLQSQTHLFEADQATKEFLGFVLAPAFVESLGAAIIDGDQEWGAIALDEDKIIIQDAFRRLAHNEIAPLAEEIHRQDLIVPDRILQPLKEMGVFGLSIPEKFGGSAPDGHDDNLTMIVVTEALSEASLGAAGSLITRPEIVTRALLSGGTEEQRENWLPKISAGDPLCAIAITEPDYGSDVASLSLKARKTDGGWVLNGAKTWCTFAGKAGLLFVVARTDPDRSLGHKGLSVFLVEKEGSDGHEFVEKQDGGGRLSGKAIPTIGYRGMHSFDLSFEDFYVPDSALMGGENGLGKGFYYTMSGLTGGRIQTAARASGVMRAALRAAIDYSRDRKVFGKQLGHYQLTRVKLAKMAAQYAASRRLTFKVAEMLDRGKGDMESSLVKLFACRTAEALTREALQIHGGMGYAEETAVSRYYVDARVLSIFEGAEETLAIKVVARELFQRALNKKDILQ